jgi:hypothetical protein
LDSNVVPGTLIPFSFLYRRSNNWFSNGFPLVLAIDNLCWFLIPMRERKNDPVLIGFHENLLLNNGNLLSTLGSIEWERASDCFVWVEAWVGVVSRHCCILSQCDIFYRESSRVRGLLSSYAMANNINTSRRLIFYLTWFFFFPFFLSSLFCYCCFVYFLFFLRGFNSIDRSDSKEQRNSSLSLHSNCNNSQCARCTVHTVFSLIDPLLSPMKEKKTSLLCVCCTHNKRNRERKRKERNL